MRSSGYVVHVHRISISPYHETSSVLVEMKVQLIRCSTVFMKLKALSVASLVLASPIDELVWVSFLSWPWLTFVEVELVDRIRHT